MRWFLQFSLISGSTFNETQTLNTVLVVSIHHSRGSFLNLYVPLTVVVKMRCWNHYLFSTMVDSFVVSGSSATGYALRWFLKIYHCVCMPRLKTSNHLCIRNQTLFFATGIAIQFFSEIKGANHIDVDTF